ncbi:MULTISPECIES: bifunctional riboflavin kinase/FAD synthetase [unclassified Actinobaculum]|uniref:bifunctional riboflavin kinase/FAD synthetase n=1 Tax=unclassified Actinobaculum TaxID=2609299 RepID=UPI000D52A24B|nr:MULTISPECIES: bifunctional riboflavin kinase/FAD synthetase [unclassified Actinobaculum]AWE43465.1 bifunctional riboflavin kinase/FAD synthetase [Actinobaculum sp. 313]RTE47987.1 bifunctional riboflavin kinase/FAD synthetase [Actinobaculum sp. 352]
MEIWRCPEDVPADLGSTVVTIGVFDGVHRGHRAVLGETVRQAKKRGMRSLALTFDPHPVTVHNPEQAVHLVTTLDDRLDRLAAAGIDIAYVQHYTLEYAAATPREFVVKQLLGELHAAVIVVGEDVRFGRDNSGDGALLRRLGEELNFDVVLLNDLTEEHGRRWSSSWVRELLACGDVAGASRVLGRPHRLRGTVVHGFRRGRELGFPTANLQGNDLGEVPADGVYAGWLVRAVPGTHAAEYLPAAISVGTNPQFDGQQRTVEAHVLGRADLNLYDEPVAIDFIERLRPMLSFDSVEELLVQMDEDLRGTAEVLGVPTAGRVDPAAVTAQ